MLVVILYIPYGGKNIYFSCIMVYFVCSDKAIINFFAVSEEMKEVNVKAAAGDEKEGVQLSTDIYVYQGHGIDVVDAGLFRLNTLGICLVEAGIYTIHLNGRKHRLHSGDFC